jgi:hypothetical protein
MLWQAAAVDRYIYNLLLSNYVNKIKPGLAFSPCRMLPPAKESNE